MAEQSLTYSGAGVDITAGNQAIELMKPLVKSTFRSEVVTDLGGFGGLFALNKDKYEEPILISGTDGVGTKLKIAFEMNKHNTIGIDAVQGRGFFQMSFERYEQVPGNVANEIIAKYQPEADKD